MSHGSKIFVTSTVDLGNITAVATVTDATIAAPGAKVGDPVTVSAAALEDGLSMQAYVAAVDLITLSVTNASAGAINPASQVFQFVVHAN